MAAALEHSNLVVEPGGAVALAAALSHTVDVPGRTMAVVCSATGLSAPVALPGLVDPERRCHPSRLDEHHWIPMNIIE